MRMTLQSTGLWLSVLAAGSLASWAVYNSIQEAQGDPALPPAVAVTPTPALLNEAPDMSEALAALANGFPAVSTIVNALLASDVERVMDGFPAIDRACDEDIVRGESLCEREGLAPGTRVTQVELSAETLPGYRLEQSAARETLDYFLRDRAPRIDLVARRGDGAYLIVVAVESRPDVTFPGAVAQGGEVSSLHFVVDQEGTVRDLIARGPGAPPLEPIQHDIRQNGRGYEILGVSAEFLALDASMHQQLEDMRRQPLNP